MGALTEGQIVTQLKKAQGETNERLDAILAEQRRTNQLLAQLAGVEVAPPSPALDTNGSGRHNRLARR
jgi:hypothetical protein